MKTDTGAHILLVDDDPMLRRATARALAACGFRVSQAENGSEALQMVGSGNIDAIVTDIHMPEMDGLSFLKAVRQQDSDIPVVLMTGEPSLESAISAVEHGATQYLLKVPIRFVSVHRSASGWDAASRRPCGRHRAACTPAGAGAGRRTGRARAGRTAPSRNGG